MRRNRRGAESKASKKRRRQRKGQRDYLEAVALDYGIRPYLREDNASLRWRTRLMMAPPMHPNCRCVIVPGPY